MNVPNHIAIIPDGNRRWAKQKNLPPFEGHRYTFDEVLPKLLTKATELGAKYFTFWAMSTENQSKRTKEEVEGLYSLGKLFYKKKLQDLVKNNVKVKFIGNISDLSLDIQTIIKESEEKTKENSKITFIIAVNYGGRDEIIRAIKRMRVENINEQELTEEIVSQYLDTTSIPDPDLIIRTGGTMRMSGFMPWQSEYSELYFSNLYFPDFTPEELEKAVQEFTNRKRNFGK